MSRIERFDGRDRGESSGRASADAATSGAQPRELAAEGERGRDGREGVRPSDSDAAARSIPCSAQSAGRDWPFV